MGTNYLRIGCIILQLTRERGLERTPTLLSRLEESPTFASPGTGNIKARPSAISPGNPSPTPNVFPYTCDTNILKIIATNSNVRENPLRRDARLAAGVVLGEEAEWEPEVAVEELDRVVEIDDAFEEGKIVDRVIVEFPDTVTIIDGVGGIGATVTPEPPMPVVSVGTPAGDSAVPPVGLVALPAPGGIATGADSLLTAGGTLAGEGFEGVEGDPAAGEPAAGEPAAGEPAAGEPAAGEPAAGDPAAGFAGAGVPRFGTGEAGVAGLGLLTMAS